jgi:dihydropyrimidinase
MKLCLFFGGFIAVCYELSASLGLRNRKAALTRVNKVPKKSVRGSYRIIQIINGLCLIQRFQLFGANSINIYTNKEVFVMTVDLVIKNSRIVSPTGIFSADVVVDDGKIVAITKASLSPEAYRVIDAKGNFLLPGIIDPHVHLGLFEHSYRDDIKDTAAALWGGVTTIGNYVGMGDTDCKGSIKPGFKNWVETYNNNAFTDAFFHCAITNEERIKEIPEYAQDFGVTSFKFFSYLIEKSGIVTSWGQEAEGVGLTDGDMYVGFQSISKLGYPALAMIHCENADIIAKLQAEIMKQKRDDLKAITDMRPNFVEAMDIQKAVFMAKITNVPLYIVHVTTAEGVEIIRTAIQSRIDVVGETCPHFLTLTYEAPLGPLGLENPPLKDKKSNEALWQGIRDGVISCIGTDHGSGTKEQKKDIWTGVPGFAGVEEQLSVLLSEGVNKGRITLEKLVEVYCYNNARVFGVYPQKGTISVGSDADLTIVDLNKTVKVRADKLHYWISDFSVFEGLELKGWPTHTILRGNVAMEEGEVTAKPGLGKYLPRKLRKT